MNKFSIIFLLTMFSLFSFVFANDESAFINAFKNCSVYSESGSLKTDGMNVKSVKNIIGWQEGKCVYKENLNFSGINAVTTCQFSQPQIDEIVSVTNAYSLINKYSKDNIDTSNLDSVKENPVVKVWNKYLQDNSTCSIYTN